VASSACGAVVGGPVTSEGQRRLIGGISRARLRIEIQALAVGICCIAAVEIGTRCKNFP